MMTEEANEDTNGESTFEFVSGPVPAPPATITTPIQQPMAADYQAPPPPLFSQANMPPGPQLMPPTYYTPPTQPTGGPPPAPSPVATPPPAYHTPSVAPQPPLPPSVVTTVPHHHHSSSPCCGGGESSSLEMPMMDLRGPVQPGGGVWGWIKSNEFLHKVAEKAKNSVDTMITTLDPGMKEHLYSGGDICLLVASEDEMEVSAAREAFQQVFGLATVQGCPLPPITGAPAQSVGFSVCMKAVEERLTTLRQSIGEEQAALLAMESLLMEITPDRWFEMSCLMLEDSSRGISLHTYTQPTPVDGEFIARAREQTPSDYPLAWLGLGVPISCIIGSALGVPQSDWHRALSGVSRRETLLSASRTLATLYKSRLH